MQGTDPNRLDELASLVSHFGQPRDSHHRRTADRYAPQIRIVKAMSRSAAVASGPAGEALQPAPVVTQPRRSASSLRLVTTLTQFSSPIARCRYRSRRGPCQMRSTSKIRQFDFGGCGPLQPRKDADTRAAVIARVPKPLDSGLSQ